MEQIYREYAAGSGSMAYGLFDATDVLRRKYRSVIDRGTIPIPPQPIKFQLDATGLADMLSACTSEKLTALGELFHLRPCKKPAQVVQLIPPLSDLFEKILDQADSTLFAFLNQLAASPVLQLPPSSAQKPQIRYLLHHGFLFHGVPKGEKGALWVLPAEFRAQVLQNGIPARMERRRLNDAICAMGTGILCHYGVVGECAFDEMLEKLVSLFRKNEKTVQVPVAHVAMTTLEFERGCVWLSDIQKEKSVSDDRKTSVESKLNEPEWRETGSANHIRNVIRLYAETSGRIRYLSFLSPPYGLFFCHGQVHDPYSIHDEQFWAREPGFRPLSCNDALNGMQLDAIVKISMAQYFERTLRMNQLKAKLLVDEWTFLIRNGEQPLPSTQRIIGQLDMMDQMQLVELMKHASMHFMNDLHQWALRGNTAMEVFKKNESIAGKDTPEVTRAMESARMSSTTESSAPSGTLRLGSKPGRNDLCPCGSGKKYKKCCGMSI